MKQALTLKAMLEEMARRYGNKTAIIMGEQRLTYSELDEAANKIAGALREQGVGKGERIVLLANNSPEFAASFFGIIKAGAIAVPLDSKYKITELESLFDNCRPRLLVSEAPVIKTILPVLSRFPYISRIIDLSSHYEKQCLTYRTIMNGCPLNSHHPDPEPQDIASILYTSGPSLQPRGVMLSHEHLVKTAGTGGNFLNQTVRDTVLQFALPMHHIMGLETLLLTAIGRGSTLVILPGLSIDALLDTVERERVTIFMGVPFVYRLMLRHATEKGIRRDLSSVRLCVVGGAPTSAALIKRFQELYRLNIVQFYGLSEAATLVSCQSPEGTDKPGSAGRALPGWPIKIVNAGGKVTSLNEPGEILVGGLITPGYYHNPAETAAAISDGWFKTGDIGFFDSNGELYICGRKKEMIIAKGQNIYPSDIETILCRHPKIAGARVLGEPDELRGEIITASIRPKNGATASEEEIRHFCRHHLANYKIPRRILFT